ncbi:MAG: hypothetical protein ACLP3Q_15715, partial [Streptosporangiaceae bacterium]
LRTLRVLHNPLCECLFYIELFTCALITQVQQVQAAIPESSMGDLHQRSDLGGLSAAGTMIALDLAFPRAAWSTLRRGAGTARLLAPSTDLPTPHLPHIQNSIAANAPADLFILHSSGMVHPSTMRQQSAPGGQP